MGEHLPYKQGSQVRALYPPFFNALLADVAELADAQDLGSCIL